MGKRVTGVLAVQGDFERHLRALEKLGCTGREVRTLEDLIEIDRLIIPGGESTTVGILLERFGLGEAIRARVLAGMPIWGTCMGMILLANRVSDRQQYSLGLLDILVVRNAFGAQVHSFEAEVQVVGMETPVLGVFIRAPIVAECGPGVEVLAEYSGNVVAVRHGNRLGTSFHPELTDDLRMHQWFCSWS